MDPIAQLQAISEELDEHASRLGARAQKIAERAEQETDPGRKELLSLIAEGFREQVDTGLDFQRELILRVADAVSAMPAGDADIGIEPQDGELLLDVLNAFRAMLETGLKNMPSDTPAAARAEWDGKLEKCKAAIDLVDGLIIEDDGEDGDGKDDDEEEEEDGAPAN